MHKLLALSLCLLMYHLSGNTMMQAHHNQPTMKIFSGPEAKPYFEQIAHLRITLFKEFPYLYKGNLKYEKEYLNTYFKSSSTVITLLFDNDKVVGFSNSIPLAEETYEITAPFKDNNLNTHEYLYVGEIMLMPSHQKKGYARKMLLIHEKRAREEGYPYITFMTVDRAEDHPYKPQQYSSPDAIWEHFGFTKRNDMKITMNWTQVDSNKETPNTLDVWIKKVN